MKSYDDINRQAAECLYTGMMTDTGAFSYKLQPHRHQS